MRDNPSSSEKEVQNNTKHFFFTIHCYRKNCAVNVPVGVKIICSGVRICTGK